MTSIDDINKHGRPIDIDSRYAHAEMRGNWKLDLMMEQTEVYNLALDEDTRREYREREYAVQRPYFESIAIGPDEMDTVDYEIPGCPEEPDVPAHATVYTPKKLKGKKNPVLFCCEGGGLVHNSKAFFDQMAMRFNCISVACDYRTTLEGGYPGTINDLHATFQWVLDNAEELRADTDNIVMYGESSGGQLAMALPFRLRRYGYKRLKGIVAVSPIVDDRTTYTSSRFNPQSGWNCNVAANSARGWLKDLYNSPHVGPEAYCNRATLEELKGYPPTFIHSNEFDPDRDAARAFSAKLGEVGAYCEFHCWGGVEHGSFDCNPEADYSKRYFNIINSNIADCFKYDLRRPWLDED
jgi:acetyl esterase/lipase